MYLTKYFINILPSPLIRLSSRPYSQVVMGLMATDLNNIRNKSRGLG